MHDLYSVTTPFISTINYCAAQMKGNFIWNEPCVSPRCMRSVAKKDMAVNWVILQFNRKVLCMNGWMHLMSITDVSHAFWTHLAWFLDVRMWTLPLTRAILYTSLGWKRNLYSYKFNWNKNDCFVRASISIFFFRNLYSYRYNWNDNDCFIRTSISIIYTVVTLKA